MLARVLIWLTAVAVLARSRAAARRALYRPASAPGLRRGSPLRGGAPLAALGLLLGACAPVLSAAPVAAAQADTAPQARSITTSTAPAGDPAAPPAATDQASGLAVQVGYASWYGPNFAGRLTSNGEIFDPSKLTAAHLTLPFGTLVKVTNLVNGESVVVRINDRGPYKDGRIIDLSRAAAAALGMEKMGGAQVRLEPLSLPDGVVRLGVGADLHGYQVLSRFHRIGQLLVLSRRSGADAVVVRVVGNDVPSSTGADVLVPQSLYDRIGSQAHVQDR